MTTATYPESIPVAGFGRNNLPTGRRYVYRGDGHDAIDPAECECGKCGWIRRRSGNPNPKNPRKGKA